MRNIQPPDGQVLAVACQLDAPVLDGRGQISGRVDELIRIVEQVVDGYRHYLPVKLIVFPEFAIMPIAYPEEALLLETSAISLPHPDIDRLADRAAELGVYVVPGSFLETDERWPGCVFNTSLLVGPGGVLARYRKVNPLLPLEPCASPHDISDYQDEMFPVVSTSIGRIGLGICYDWLFPETTRELALQGAEILIRISAWMNPWGSEPPADSTTLINRARAVENTAYVVASSLGSSFEHHPPYAWTGGSMVVDYEGRVLANVGDGSGTRFAVAPIDMHALRAHRRDRRLVFPLAHYRPEAYTRMRSARSPLEPLKDNNNINPDVLAERVDGAKKRLGFL
jgi:formamidase